MRSSAASGAPCPPLHEAPWPAPSWSPGCRTSSGLTQSAAGEAQDALHTQPSAPRRLRTQLRLKARTSSDAQAGILLQSAGRARPLSRACRRRRHSSVSLLRCCSMAGGAPDRRGSEGGVKLRGGALPAAAQQGAGHACCRSGCVPVRAQGQGGQLAQRLRLAGLVVRGTGQLGAARACASALSGVRAFWSWSERAQGCLLPTLRSLQLLDQGLCGVLARTCGQAKRGLRAWVRPGESQVRRSVHTHRGSSAVSSCNSAVS